MWEKENKKKEIDEKGGTCKKRKIEKMEEKVEIMLVRREKRMREKERVREREKRW